MQILRAFAVLALFGCAASSSDTDTDAPQDGWIPLFNGRDLDGWIPKIRGHELGEDPDRVFRVEDGLLRVVYDGYEQFDARFGHLFFETAFDSYDLRIEYRFVGEQVPGGPGWAWRNSGAMLHCQPPESMTVDQDFPVSIEAQFLGGPNDETKVRTTANLCTPGTHVEQNGELVTNHCVSSTSETYRGDDWVTVTLEVRGGETVRHVMEGEVVLEYQRPQLDPGDPTASALLAAGAESLLTGGWIALQSESHSIDFRSVELRQVR